MKFYEINLAIKEEMQLDPGLVSDAERIRFINDCSREIAALQLVEASSVGDTSSQYPTIPTDLIKLKTLYWEGIRLSALTNRVDFTSEGVPVAFIFEGAAIRLYPIPTSEGELKWIYSYLPTQMTADMLVEASAEEYAKTPNVPLGWETLYVDYACYRSHRKNGNISMANLYHSDYRENLASKIRDYVSRLNSNPVTSNTNEISVSGDTLANIAGIF